MDKIDFNNILKKLSTMDKSELEANLKKAQQILNSSNIDMNKDKK